MGLVMSVSVVSNTPNFRLADVGVESLRDDEGGAFFGASFFFSFVSLRGLGGACLSFARLLMISKEKLTMVLGGGDEGRHFDLCINLNYEQATFHERPDLTHYCQVGSENRLSTLQRAIGTGSSLPCMRAKARPCLSSANRISVK